MIMENEQIESYISQMEALVKNISFFYKQDKKVYTDELEKINQLVNKLLPIAVTE